jgi:hypothetical protein
MVPAALARRLSTNPQDVPPERRINMKTALTALAACMTLAVSVAAYQTPPPAQQQQQQAPPAPAAQQPGDPQKAPPDVTLTGCLIQGSTPAIYLFDNAKKDRNDKSEKAGKYLVLISGEDLDLRSHLNKEVSMTGRVELKPAPAAGKPVLEKDLSTFATKSVTLVSDTCGSAK